MMHCTLGLVAVCLATLFQNGEALRCWACSSDLDPNCLDHFNTTKLIQQNSYFQQSNYNLNNNYRRNDIPALVECSNNLGQIYGQKQVCVKRVLNVPYGKKIISRECKAVSSLQGAGACPERNNNIEFCEYCEYDGCNGASGLRGGVLLAAALSCLLLFFLRR